MARRGGNDELATKLLKSKDRVEALQWLTGAKAGVHRNIGEMTERQSSAYIRRLYRHGATEVFVVQIGVNREFESTDTLILTLPDDPTARKAIFDAEGDRTEKMGYEREEDHGQRHLLIWFD